ncbi:MAG: hypothetical protein RRX88_07045, partial [Raoultibacter sp.]
MEENQQTMQPTSPRQTAFACLGDALLVILNRHRTNAAVRKYRYRRSPVCALFFACKHFDALATQKFYR